MSSIVTPRISEKSFAASKLGTYTFDVSLAFNKQQIAAAVEARYGVTVTNITTAVNKGKALRTHRGKGKFVNATRKDTKKAYVRLKDGETIAAFEEAAS